MRFEDACIMKRQSSPDSAFFCLNLHCVKWDFKLLQAVMNVGTLEEVAHEAPVKLETDGHSGKPGKQNAAQTNW